MNSTTSTPDEQQNAKPGNGRRKAFLMGLFLIVLIGAAAYAAYYYLHARWYESTDDAYVDGNVVQITPMSTGTVISIGADDGNRVEAGQELVRFDPSDAEVRQQSAEATLAKTVRQVRGLFSNVDAYKSDVSARRVALEKARSDYNRRQKLAKSGAISQEEFAHAKDELASAQSALSSAEQQLNTNRALIDQTDIADHPDVRSAAANLRQAYLDSARSRVLAPVSGYVAKRTVQLGNRVQPGTALMAIIPLDQVWVDANFKETQLRNMRIGQPVEVHADLYGDDITYRGTVESLGVGTGSAFSLLPAQNASGNWIKIVQRVPVRIRLDADDLKAHPLRIGLSMLVTVDIHDTDGSALAEMAPQQPAFSTDIYHQQLQEADELIARLIRDNSAAPTQAAAR
ncbi:HlyD family secretion protein [Pseudomonas matsuisoli]|uniref:Multidrug resistance protein n=1 Tax=Pseudomonas matsuisoli TaxID=1515666 RepID=A0A917PMC8_9PSED|nr:efflux RND transporter periplasmic adaptor subunit [Pseudomonas matsuisoli]GGJ83728.1 multidrug resistance protein [Pseudomonas matsuisoli]